MYLTTKREFINDSKTRKIADELGAELGVKAGEPEYVSWTNSLKKFGDILNRTNIPDDITVICEYQLKNLPNRCDVILLGCDARGRRTMLVIELKQWSNDRVSASQADIDKNMVHVKGLEGNRDGKTKHPVFQVSEYVNVFKKAYEAVAEENISVYGCAYLHEYELTDDCILRAGFEVSNGYKYVAKGRNIFGCDNEEELVKILNFLFALPCPELKDIIINSEVRPNDEFVDRLAAFAKGSEIFASSDEHKRMIALIDDVSQKGDKHVIIVQGSPGTGKTVAAFNSILYFAKKKKNVVYLTKNSQLRRTFLKYLSASGTKDDFKKNFNGLQAGMMFSYLSNIEGPNVKYDLIVADEAQHMDQKTVSMIIQKSTISVFLMDKDQRIDLRDIKSMDHITSIAWGCGIPGTNIHRRSFVQQYRMNGGANQIGVVKRILGEKTGEECKPDESNYTVRLVKTPDELFRIIREKNSSGLHARVGAGLCWKWKYESMSDSNVTDITIDESGQTYEYSWNNYARKEWLLSGEGSDSTELSTIDEVGCVHTMLGQELEYVGVIIGDDLKYDTFNHKVVEDPDKNTAFYEVNNGKWSGGYGIGKNQKYKTFSQTSMYEGSDNKEKLYSEAQAIIRNMYRILLTRGKRGCYIYCTDNAMKEYLNSFIQYNE